LGKIENKIISFKDTQFNEVNKNTKMKNENNHVKVGMV